MKKAIILFAMTCTFTGAVSGKDIVRNETESFPWTADRFGDIRVLRYQVPGFEELSLQEKKQIYYLNQAALCGRDIIYDQHFKYNLPIRRTLEAIYTHYDGNKETTEWKAFEKYLKQVWFANGIHHHYSKDKFVPEFDAAYFDQLVAAVPDRALPLDFGTRDELLAVVRPAIFDPALYAKQLDQRHGIDMLKASSANYYEDITQAEAEAFYAAMADPSDPTPVSYGLNSKLVKENGMPVEKTWKVGGMYSPAIERIVYWLEKAASVAGEHQRGTIEMLIDYYRTGDLKTFDRFNISWLQDTLSRVDFVNGFTETYGDPLGYKGAWEALVNFRNEQATVRAEIISENAQWFEDHSPVEERFKKKSVKGVSAKVITAAMLGGDCYPATPIGINLPNADWIRRDHGSKSVTIENITAAYNESARGNGFIEEFMLRPQDRALLEKYGAMVDNLHTDLHECLGHASGQLAPGVKGDELKQYGSTLEEARADLFALYYLADPQLVALGITPDGEAYKAEYAKYVMNGLMTQLMRIEPGKNVEEAHMRNRKLITEWCYRAGKEDKVIEWVEQNGKTYVVVNDFTKLRELFGSLLREIQRIKSEGDFEAGKRLVEEYGVKVDPALHAQVLERYAALDIEPYSGFVNPVYEPVMRGGEIVDVKIGAPRDYVSQMLSYSSEYSFLPSRN